MVVLYDTTPVHIRIQYKYKYKNTKYEKYENTSRKGRYFYTFDHFTFIVGSVTSWMNIKYTYIIEFKLLWDRDRIDPFRVESPSFYKTVQDRAYSDFTESKMMG